MDTRPKMTTTVSSGFAASLPPAFFNLGIPLFPAPPPPWHAIRVAPRREFRVFDQLTAQGFDAYCPRYWLTWVSRNRRYEALIPYLATWVFARWAANNPYLWHTIHNLTGVNYFIGGEDPAPILDNEMETLRKKIGEDNRLIQAAPAATQLQPGDHIILLDGPFSGYNAIITWVNSSRHVVQVRINALHGRIIPLTCSASWCESAQEHDATPANQEGGTARLRQRGRRGGTSRGIRKIAFLNSS